jgi:protease stability complex PrcB-like protein
LIFAGSGSRPAPAGIRYRSRVTDPEAAPVPFRTLRRSGSHASSESTPEPGLFILRRPILWTSLWARMHSGEEPQPATPEVDWDSEMVVALVLGWRPTTGYAVDLEEITFTGADLRVRARETRPGGMTGQMVTAPFHFAAAPALEIPGDLLLIQRITTTDDA